MPCYTSGFADSFDQTNFLQGSTVDYFTVLKVMSMLEKAQTDAGQKTKSFFGGYTVTFQQSKSTQNDRLYSTLLTLLNLSKIYIL
jgi:hypothetical protein